MDRESLVSKNGLIDVPPEPNDESTSLSQPDQMSLPVDDLVLHERILVSQATIQVVLVQEDLVPSSVRMLSLAHRPPRRPS